MKKSFKPNLSKCIFDVISVMHNAASMKTEKLRKKLGNIKKR